MNETAFRTAGACTMMMRCKEAETDSRAKLGEETVAGAHRRPKWVPYYSPQDAQALHRYAHPQLKLKQQQLTLGG